METLDKCKENFMQYLDDNYVGFEGVEGSFLRETVNNLLDYAYANFGHSKDWARYFISDILPDEIDYGEIERFLPEFR